MIKYCIKKFKDYYLRKIDKNLEAEAIQLFNNKELEIYNNMQYYDKLHGLDVYKEMKKICNDKTYLKFSILHDCGKIYAPFYKRVLHKLGLKTKLALHTEMGYEILKDIDIEIANLIRDHHKKNTTGLLKKFQEIDDRS